VNPAPQRPSSAVTKKVQRLKPEKATEMFWLPHLKLLFKRYRLDEIEKKLFMDKMTRKGEVSIRDIEDSLKSDPFDLNEDDQALQIARFLIAETIGQGEFAGQMDREEATDNAGGLKRVFREMLGQYQLFEANEEKAASDLIAAVLGKNPSTIKTSLEIKAKSNHGCLSAHALKSTLEDLGLKLKEGHVNFLLVKLRDHSESFENLNYQALFQIFPTPMSKLCTGTGT
jgi:hypothetical protein